MLKNMKMSTKFIMTGIFLFILMFFIAFMSQSSISNINESAKLMNQYENIYKELKNIESEMFSWREPMINMFLGEDLDLKKIQTDPEKSLLNKFLKSQALTDFYDHEPEFKALTDSIKKPYNTMFNNTKTIVSAWNEGDVDTAIDTFKTKLKKSFDTSVLKLHDMTKFIGEKVEVINEKNSNVASSSKLNLIIAVVVSMILMVGIGTIVMKKFLSKMNLLKHRAKDLSEGEADLTKIIDVDSTDEFGELAGYINSFINKVLELVRKINMTSKDIKRSTEDVSSGSSDLAQRTNEQAASITETSTTLEEFTSFVTQNSQNSEEVNIVLKEFNEEIQQKSELIENVTNTMEEIDSSSKKINSIINVINDISFQTNLLALNAAVEAARAGEAGRGFAVVASEVRNLAGKTADSSKVIQEIVNKNVESTQRGMELVTETSAFFKQILQVTFDILDKVKSISDGSKKQTTGIEQINQAIAQLDDVINKNASLVQDLSDSSKNMKLNSETLFDLVNTFKIDNGDVSSVSTATTSAGSRPDSQPRESGRNGSTSTKSQTQPNRKSSAPAASKPATSEKIEDDFFSEDEEGFEEF